jgi:hypothetical protein
MTKQDLWPKEGKLKKGLIILAIVIVAALLITLLEEKTNFKAGRKLPMAIAFASIAVWVYKPAFKKEATRPNPANKNQK